MSGDNRILCVLNQSMSMFDALLPTDFTGPSVIANQRCDSVVGFIVRVLGNEKFYYC